MTWREGFEDAGVDAGADVDAGAGAGTAEFGDPTLSTTTWILPSPAITDFSGSREAGSGRREQQQQPAARCKMQVLAIRCGDAMS